MAVRIGITKFRTRPKHKRPGVHAKSKQSFNKNSKHYVKVYRGQGR